jgi:hypothetical protein
MARSVRFVANGIVYEEFCGFDYKTQDAPLLAIAIFDGDVDIYGCDDVTCRPEIERMYQVDYSRQPESLSFYRKVEG